jgi:hypothetical protein
VSVFADHDTLHHVRQDALLFFHRVLAESPESSDDVVCQNIRVAVFHLGFEQRP